jgi:hypothetical protein
MHGALGNRLAGLLKFLKRLKKIRARLYDHIVRVNDVSSTHPTNPKTWALPCKVAEMHDANGTGGSFLLWWFVFFVWYWFSFLQSTIDDPHPRSSFVNHIYYLFFLYPRSTGQNSKRT